MNITTTVANKAPPPFPFPFPSPHRTLHFSPLQFTLGLLAVISLPALIYSLFFFFSIHCPLSLRRRFSPRLSPASSLTTTDFNYNKNDHFEVVGAECPVCLSLFADGDRVRRLSACGHSFHVSCIDMWLLSHSNCPLCRAAVAVKCPNRSRASGNDDFQQGLPDAGSLV